MLPLHTLNGFPETYVFKPDTPRKEIKESGEVRLVKYEYPACAQVRLDVPPCCSNLVLDPEIPLLFVEGWKKGDKGATEGPPGRVCLDARYQETNLPQLSTDEVWQSRGWQISAQDREGNSISAYG